MNKLVREIIIDIERFYKLLTVVVPFFMHSFFSIMKLEYVFFNLEQHLINKLPDTKFVRGI
jgi:hypothetical protein